MGLGAKLGRKFQQQSERIERERAEFNLRSIQSWVPANSRVLDVGAWACYLGELLRDHKGCDVLSLDVADSNKTNMPFRVFDGKTLPVESKTFDVVLVLYVLHHAADDEPLLREASRVLRDEGHLLVAEDCVDGLWNKILTFGFHIWLYLITRMSRDGKFRTTHRWHDRFREAGFQVDATMPLGNHLGHFLWPRNVLFVLRKQPASKTASATA